MLSEARWEVRSSASDVKAGPTCARPPAAEAPLCSPPGRQRSSRQAAGSSGDLCLLSLAARHFGAVLQVSCFSLASSLPPIHSPS